MLSNAFIPYGGYYSSPFARWQGSLANENAITLGSETARRWLAHKNWEANIFDYLILGVTVGQPKMFYGGPWASALIGAVNTPGLLISQACSTSGSRSELKVPVSISPIAMSYVRMCLYRAHSPSHPENTLSPAIIGTIG